MAETITAQFASRRDAETAVEHLVQEHGIDRNDVRILAASQENTAGTKRDGADLEGGRAKTGTEGEPALNGRITVSACVDAARAGAVGAAFETYGGTGITS